MNLSDYESVNAAKWNDDSEDEAEAKKPHPSEFDTQKSSTLTSRLSSTTIQGNLDCPHSETIGAAGENEVLNVNFQNRPRTMSYRTTTCRYWANGDKCKYTRDSCRFLHEYKLNSEVRSPPGRQHANWKYDQPPMENTRGWTSGELIEKINISDLPSIENIPQIGSCKYLASYNWLEHSMIPTILVPGSPRMWSPVASTNRLKEDSGGYFRDLNAAKYPSYPSEPTFRALLAMQPDFDLSGLDVVGCGSTLGNLLRFCESTSADFRFDIDRIKETVFFIRKESSPTAMIYDIHGYGHSFPEAHTSWDPEVAGSLSHQRIIQYDFGGFKFLVRTACDGYIKEVISLDTLLCRTTGASFMPDAREDLDKAQNNAKDDVPATFAALQVTESPPPPKESLQVKNKGWRVPQEAIFDLKTRAKATRRPIDMNEIYRRLWVNQTPYFIHAEHYSGCFKPSEIQPLFISDDVLKWEKDHALLLKKYLAIVIKLIAASKRSINGKLQVIRRGKGPLEIRERIAGVDDEVLPSDLRSRWWTWR